VVLGLQFGLGGSEGFGLTAEGVLGGPLGAGGEARPVWGRGWRRVSMRARRSSWR